jgi:putative redox protein
MSESISTSAAAAHDQDAGKWVTTRIGGSGFRADIAARSHTFISDEPVALGGTDTGPTPYELLLGALSSCTAMTLRVYAKRKGWPLESVEVRMRQTRTHEEDCEKCEREAVGITHIERDIDIGGALTDEQRKRLLEIADRCPVKQTLEHGIHIVIATKADSAL